MQNHDLSKERSSQEIPLGKQVEYPSQYQPELLFPVARQLKRDEINIQGQLPFHGTDIWNAYELSWLNSKGKPQVAIAVFEFDCASTNIIESKSFKLYLNSLNQTRFTDWPTVEKTLTEDLSKAAGATVSVKLYEVEAYNQSVPVNEWQGILLDEQDIEVNSYQYDPELLEVDSEEETSESLYSHLLKSNCLITSQPDWASILIEYKGPKINHESLLKYLISFRNHNEFHEQCVERVFTDILRHCKPSELTVYARYTRRGGLDINPWRSNVKAKLCSNQRHSRQ
ncbi:NADPH-dependent 7-cyano-7-deazaguanine reductase QueF [Kangiella profundi]|uniref:NADPH-dependent 7-cyano-7-deazaguanine reductase n=1 Tax=Kangiella profundi TaxID=1561924 RepID=A0A2K9AL07_9GAMM|nr:NADPH-dependent 7-cyano-7-deazaguanine reductase QueF [Kangiella profundi]AUD78322.1 NADPH-dependent 7-cyano-7-deazaguanine reductase QueF [Kangiella profundi]GGF07067.1 NADPH-dependent 7-cyano-7-deazaguanine reductase [Kangiella profundi]